MCMSLRMTAQTMQAGLACCAQSLCEGGQDRVVSRRDDGRHEQGCAQRRRAALADMATPLQAGS
jgi:hypothetical protein